MSFQDEFDFVVGNKYLFSAMFRKRPESRIPAKDLNQIKPNPLSYGIPDGFDFDEYRNQSKSFQKKADLITILIKLAIISILLWFSILVFEIVTGYNSKFIVFCVPFIGLSLLVWFGMHNGIYSRLSKIIPKSGPLSYWNEMEAYTVSIEHWNYMHSETEEGYWLQKRGRDFEVAIADMLLRRGVDADLTPQTNDGGIDIIISIDKKKYFSQCKAHASPVSASPIREIAGVCRNNNAHPVLFCINGLTVAARKAANDLGVTVVDCQDICRIARKNKIHGL